MTQVEKIEQQILEATEQLEAEREKEQAKVKAEGERQAALAEAHAAQLEKEAEYERNIQRLANREELSFVEINGLIEPLELKIKDAENQIALHAKPAEGTFFEWPHQLKQRQENLQTAQTELERLKLLQADARDAMNNLPETEAWNRFRHLRGIIKDCEARQKVLAVYKSETRYVQEWNREWLPEWDALEKSKFAAQQELDRVYTRDRSLHGALERFRDGLRVFVHQNKIYEAEIFVKATIRDLGASWNRKTEWNLPWPKYPGQPDHQPQPRPAYSDEVQNMTIDDAEMVLEFAALDARTAYPIDWATQLQNAARQIFKEADVFCSPVSWWEQDRT